jgi:hypothetical protein
MSIRVLPTNILIPGEDILNNYTREATILQT